jgi:hypothetical protein
MFTSADYAADPYHFIRMYMHKHHPGVAFSCAVQPNANNVIHRWNSEAAPPTQEQILASLTQADFDDKARQERVDSFLTGTRQALLGLFYRRVRALEGVVFGDAEEALQSLKADMASTLSALE